MNNSFWECKAYAAYLKDDIELTNSTSGGVFYGFASWCINMGGVCYGVTMDENFNVFHKRATTLEELESLRRSKYVQSRTGQAYKMAKEDLDNGLTVLFSGTPCQIAGLKAFLQKDYLTLFTVEVFCHGVPSNRLFKQHVHFLENKANEKIKEFQFRNKDKGWTPVEVSYKFDKNIEYKLCYGDAFFYYFDTSVSLRLSCYNCRFRSLASGADVAIGDYWGISLVHPDFRNDNKGISAVILKTQRGEELWRDANSAFVCIPTKVAQLAKTNIYTYRNIGRKKVRKAFFDNYIEHRNEESVDLKSVYEESIKKHIEKKLDILGSFSLFSGVSAIFSYDYTYSTQKHMTGTTLSTMFGQAIDSDVVERAYSKNIYRKNCLTLDWGRRIQEKLLKEKRAGQIVVDLLDERLPIIELENGIRLAGSEACFEAVAFLDPPIKKIWLMEEICEEDWKKGCDNLADLLKKSYGEDNIIIVRLLLSKRHGDLKEQSLFPSEKHIATVNNELNKRYDYLISKLPDSKVVDMQDLDGVYTPDYYRHGCFPEYYDDMTYIKLGESIYHALGEEGWRF